MIGMPATTDGDRVAGEETPFTMFVFEVEKLLPSGTQSNRWPHARNRLSEKRRSRRGGATIAAHAVAQSKTCELGRRQIAIQSCRMKPVSRAYEAMMVLVIAAGELRVRGLPPKPF